MQLARNFLALKAVENISNDNIHSYRSIEFKYSGNRIKYKCRNLTQSRPTLNCYDTL